MARATLEALLGEHRALYGILKEKLTENILVVHNPQTQKESSKDDKNVAHYQYTTQKQSNKLEATPRGLRGRRDGTGRAPKSRIDKMAASSKREKGSAQGIIPINGLNSTSR